MVKVLSIVESSRKVRTENDPYLTDKKNEAPKSDLFIAEVNSCSSLDSQKIHTGAYAKVTCVIHSLKKNINSSSSIDSVLQHCILLPIISRSTSIIFLNYVLDPFKIAVLPSLHLHM